MLCLIIKLQSKSPQEMTVISLTPEITAFTRYMSVKPSAFTQFKPLLISVIIVIYPQFPPIFKTAHWLYLIDPNLPLGAQNCNTPAA